MKIRLEDLVYHLGYKCNLSCRGCVNYSNHLEAHKLPWNTNWHEEINTLVKRFHVGFVEIIGGEPLQHPDIKNILIHACEKIDQVQLTTNGLLLAENMWLKELLDTHDNFKILVSYHHDPTQPTKYNKMMNKSLSTFLGYESSTIKKILDRVFYSRTTEQYAVSEYNDGRVQISLKDVPNQTQKRTWRYPELDEQEIPLRYNNNPTEAYRSCLCPWLHYVDGKIYKCSMTGTMRQIVQLKDSLDNWPLLRDYEAYDVFAEHNQEKFDRLFGVEGICTYCPVQGQWQYDKIDQHSKIVALNV